MSLLDIAAAWGPALTALSGTLGQLANQSIAFDLAKYKHENGMTKSQEGQAQGEGAIDPEREKKAQKPVQQVSPKVEMNQVQIDRNEWIKRFTMPEYRGNLFNPAPNNYPGLGGPQ